MLRLRGGASRDESSGGAGSAHKTRGNAFIDKVRHHVEKQNSDVSPDFWSALAASENAGFVEAVGAILAEEDVAPPPAQTPRRRTTAKARPGLATTLRQMCANSSAARKSRPGNGTC